MKMFFLSICRFSCFFLGTLIREQVFHDVIAPNLLAVICIGVLATGLAGERCQD
jgi:hypothetical protein